MTVPFPELPQLRQGTFKNISPATWQYNCIAWAAGRGDRWWWPDPQSYWPEGTKREPTIEAFVEAYGLLGYQVCTDEGYDPDFEKIAIYADASGPQHAARQLPNGLWTSKLGPNVDIEHANLACLEGGMYGRVVLIMRRSTELDTSS